MEDHVPAMLDGSFIINKETARRFYEQLQAINEGRAPVKISAPEGLDVKRVAQGIAKELRRNLRRGK